ASAAAFLRCLDCGGRGENGGQRPGGEGVDRLIGVELGVDQALGHDPEDGGPHDARDPACRGGVELALGEDLPGDVFDVRAVGADEVADAGADDGIVEADADQLDVKGVGGAALFEHGL